MHTVCSYAAGSKSASVPSPQLAELLGLQWTGKDFEFADESGALVAFSPNQHANSYSLPCIVDQRQMVEMLAANGLTLIWGVVGERSCHDYYAHRSVADCSISFSGVYSLDNKGRINGGITLREITEIPQTPDGKAGNAPYLRRRKW
jgi:hypothetical protein